jgi:hypothetical protein
VGRGVELSVGLGGGAAEAVAFGVEPDPGADVLGGATERPEADCFGGAGMFVALELGVVISTAAVIGGGVAPALSSCSASSFGAAPSFNSGGASDEIFAR